MRGLCRLEGRGHGPPQSRPMPTQKTQRGRISIPQPLCVTILRRTPFNGLMEPKTWARPRVKSHLGSWTMCLKSHTCALLGRSRFVSWHPTATTHSIVPSYISRGERWVANDTFESASSKNCGVGAEANKSIGTFRRMLGAWGGRGGGESEGPLPLRENVSAYLGNVGHRRGLSIHMHTLTPPLHNPQRKPRAESLRPTICTANSVGTSECRLGSPTMDHKARHGHPLEIAVRRFRRTGERSIVSCGCRLPQVFRLPT